MSKHFILAGHINSHSGLQRKMSDEPQVYYDPRITRETSILKQSVFPMNFYATLDDNHKPRTESYVYGYKPSNAIGIPEVAEQHSKAYTDFCKKCKKYNWAICRSCLI